MRRRALARAILKSATAAAPSSPPLAPSGRSGRFGSCASKWFRSGPRRPNRRSAEIAEHCVRRLSHLFASLPVRLKLSGELGVGRIDAGTSPLPNRFAIHRTSDVDRLAHVSPCPTGPPRDHQPSVADGPGVLQSRSCRSLRRPLLDRTRFCSRPEAVTTLAWLLQASISSAGCRRSLGAAGQLDVTHRFGEQQSQSRIRAAGSLLLLALWSSRAGSSADWSFGRRGGVSGVAPGCGRCSAARGIARTVCSTGAPLVGRV